MPDLLLKTYLFLLAGLIALNPSGAAHAQQLKWDQAAGSVSLENGEKTVWSLKIKKGACKPCIYLQKSRALEAGEKLDLLYRIKVHNNALQVKDIESEFDAFSKTKQQG